LFGVLFVIEPETAAFLAVAIVLATVFLPVGLGVEARLFSIAGGVTARRLLPTAVAGRLSKLAPTAAPVDGAAAKEAEEAP
jgi:hypothetical protein